MPIYEYRCLACHAVFTFFFRTIQEAETTAVVCPRCGGKEVRRRISRVSVHTGASQPTDEQGEEVAEPEKPPVFGRKELQEIMRQREQWRQEVEAGE